jgi:hypothetical protein
MIPTIMKENAERGALKLSVRTKSGRNSGKLRQPVQHKTV